MSETRTANCIKCKEVGTYRVRKDKSVKCPKCCKKLNN